MELTLTHVQRLNLHALMGAQRGPTLDDTRAFWKLQDMIALSDEEKKAIDFKIVPVVGGSAPAWDAEKDLALRTFEFTTEELQRVENAVKGWQPGFMASVDRIWLEPLLEQFESAKNGVEKTKPQALRRAR